VGEKREAVRRQSKRRNWMAIIRVFIKRIISLKKPIENIGDFQQQSTCAIAYKVVIFKLIRHS